MAVIHPLNPWLIFASSILAVAIFAIDLMMPFGDAGGVPYVALVCLGWWHPRPRAVFFFAGVSSVLVLLAHWLTPNEAPGLLSLSSRLLALIAIWVTAALLVMARTAEAALIQANDDLEQQVRERTRELEQEIAERRQAEAIITHMANHDSLTGLPIRPLFMDRLNRALAAARRSGHLVAVMFVDLDGFKSVNDTHGHEAGDALLREAAQRLQECVRETDTVARHGGDEFTVVLTEVTDQKAVTAIAEKMLSTIATPFPFRDDQSAIGCSIGITLYPQDGDRAEVLLERADAAMYAAKQRGKNQSAFHDAMEPDTQAAASQ